MIRRDGTLVLGNQVPDALIGQRINVGKLLGAERERVTQRARQAAGLADVVDDGHAMVRQDDEGQQAFRLFNELFISASRFHR